MSWGPADIPGHSRAWGVRERDFNRLAHVMVEAGKSQICRAAIRLETWRGRRSSPRASWRLNSLLLRGAQSFVLSQLSADGVSPTRIMEGKLLSLESADLNYNLVTKTLSQKHLG